ncbi:MAG TPA: carboxypeptidase regulatory-like domain-containing protein [Vicinamibacterales bacterium]|nr:carboxypeptidase regulatory-like domain-containing protein [Vicinamibacterales bacterium]
MRTFAAVIVALAVQQAPRFPAPAPDVGTGILRGRVVASDTGAPVQQVAVTISAPGVTPRTLFTDREGRYEARSLPAGRYSVAASPSSHQAQFLHVVAGDNDRSVTVAAGQTVDWPDIALVRAGAIVGRVVDDYGEPVSGILISARRTGDPPGRGGMPFQASDEFGRYRVYRLPAGEYEILARPPQIPMARGSGATMGFVDTYYPNAASRDGTTRVFVREGQEVRVDDLRLRVERLMRVRGVVSPASAARADPPPMVSLMREGGGMSRSVDSDGAFAFDLQRPGDYRLIVRQFNQTREATLGYGSMPLTLTSRDVDGIVLTVKPTATVAGRLVFEGAAAPGNPGALSVRAERPQRELDSQLILTPARVADDSTFTLRDLATELLLRPSGGLPGLWSLKAVLLDGADITDVPREFRTEDSGRIQIVLTERWAEVTGLVTGEGGAPARSSLVVLFGEDRAAWFTESSRIRAAYADREGRFNLRGVRSGRYHLAALPPGTRWDFQQLDKRLLEKLAADVPPIAIAEGERLAIDLAVRLPLW